MLIKISRIKWIIIITMSVVVLISASIALHKRREIQNLNVQLSQIESEISGATQAVVSATLERNEYLVQGLYAQGKVPDFCQKKVRKLRALITASPASLRKFASIQNDLNNYFSQELVSTMKTRKFSSKLPTFIKSLKTIEGRVNDLEHHYTDLNDKKNRIIGQLQKMNVPNVHEEEPQIVLSSVLEI